MRRHSKAIAALMLTLCVGSSFAASVANVFEQCGGTSCPSGECKDSEWAGTKCADGLKCFRESPYYYQCRATARVWQQCGGTSCQFTGLCADKQWATCTDNHSCVRKSNYYWQCTPAQAATQASIQSTKPASADSHARYSKAQLAHVPIPRHSLVHVSSKQDSAAADAAFAIASVTPASASTPEALPTRIRPAASAQSVEITALNKRKEHPAQPYGDKDSSDKEETHKSKKEKREEIKAKKEEKKEEIKAKKEEHKSKKDSEPSSSGEQVHKENEPCAPHVALPCGTHKPEHHKEDPSSSGKYKIKGEEEDEEEHKSKKEEHKAKRDEIKAKREEHKAKKEEKKEEKEDKEEHDVKAKKEEAKAKKEEKKDEIKAKKEEKKEELKEKKEEKKEEVKSKREDHKQEVMSKKEEKEEHKGEKKVEHKSKKEESKGEHKGEKRVYTAADIAAFPDGVLVGPEEPRALSVSVASASRAGRGPQPTDDDEEEADDAVNTASLQWHRPALSTATVDGHKLPHHRREHVRPMARAARPEVSAAAVAAEPAIAQPTAAAAAAEPSVSIKRHAPAVDAQVAIAAAAQPAKAAEPQVATAAAAAAPKEDSKVAAAALKPAAKADTAVATAAPAGPLAAPRRLMQAAFDAAWAVNALFNRH